MKTFIGTKIIKAKPMTRQEYNDYRGWETPDNEKDIANEAGFLVEYDDSEHQNHHNHTGYISWSPGTVFDDAYRATTGMPFGFALEALKKGKRVSRTGWNGKGMYIESTNFIGVEPCFIIVNGSTINTWVPSISDCYADDWEIVN